MSEEETGIVKSDGYSESDVIENMPIHVAAAFEIYYNLEGRRSFDALISHLTKENGWIGNTPSKSQVANWSKTYRWQDIIQQRLQHEYSILKSEFALEREQRRKRRIQVADNVLHDALLIINKADLENLSSDEARKLLPVAKSIIEMALKSERQELGEIDEKYKAPKPIEQMTDEELERLAGEID